jgi:thiol-disulfide isomerase/thioredoxin
LETIHKNKVNSGGKEMRGLVVNVQRKVWVFPALALLTLIIGHLCRESCVFLHGDILGLDLETFGVFFYSALLLAVILFRSFSFGEGGMKLIAAIVSIGVGAEIILLKFQIQNKTYCPKCLISGFFLIGMFFVISRHIKAWIVILLIVFGAIFTSLTFSGSVIPSYAEEIRYPIFGSEKSQTEIIIYSDYLCPACRKVDSQLNDSLRKLNNHVKIRFIDVPLHPGSLEYAKLFLYAWFESGNNLERALKVRDILFHEAQMHIPQHEVLRSLSMQGIPYKKDEDTAKMIFGQVYNPLMQTDKIHATPTLVIVKDKQRKAYIGGSEIIKAIEEVVAHP